MSEAAYECLRDALTIARGDDAPRTVAALRKRLAAAGHAETAIDEALRSWAGSVIERTMPATD